MQLLEENIITTPLHNLQQYFFLYLSPKAKETKLKQNE